MKKWLKRIWLKIRNSIVKLFNKRKMEDIKIINGDCWIAYFDILGFSNMVENFPIEFVREQCKEAKKKSEEYNVNCKFIFFSDTFIFYTENDSADSFRGISAASELFFQAMFLKEIPMRGCLNVGKFYADEENGIFFGSSFKEAHDLAERQNWIGFVLSKEARKKLEGFEPKDYESNRNFRYLEYVVPYQKLTKTESKPIKLLVYYPNILNIESNPGPADYQHKRLLKAIDIMESNTRIINRKENNYKIVDHRNDQENKKIITKYKNTRDFLLYAYPLLRERFEQKYPIPKITNDDEM